MVWLIGSLVRSGRRGKAKARCPRAVPAQQLAGLCSLLLTSPPHPCLRLPCLPPCHLLVSLVLLQVGIIRQTEVDVEAELESQRKAHADERSKHKRWANEATKWAKEIAERDGGWGWGGACGVE